MIPIDTVHSKFDKVPYSKIGEFGNMVKSLVKCPKNIIGNKDEIYFGKISFAFRKV